VAAALAYVADQLHELMRSGADPERVAERLKLTRLLVRDLEARVQATIRAQSADRIAADAIERAREP
jgi:hypothetical protein